MNFVPILIFAFNRPNKLLATLNALSLNNESKNSNLYIYCDGYPKNISYEEEKQIILTREIAKNESRFNQVKVIEVSENQGLANSVIKGINYVTSFSNKLIILEDDIITSNYFLKFMNDALTLYEYDQNVASICGYWYPTRKINSETFFLRCSSSWGWGTWRRAWDKFEIDGEILKNKILKNNLKHSFDLDGTVNYFNMLEDQIRQKNDSWAIRWYASIFLNKMLCLYPSKSLVNNIGFDGSGVHSGNISIFNTQVSKIDIKVYRIEKNELKQAFVNLRKFYIKGKYMYKLNKLIQLIKKCFFNFQLIFT